MNGRTAFYQSHLDRVSRSFAFCIARLDSPLREQIGLSYLICRILDSIEDANWIEKSEQVQQFKDFDQFLSTPFEDKSLAAWIEKFPELPQGEQLLVQDSAVIFRDFQALPLSIRSAISEPVLSMSRGMLRFATGNETLRLKDLDEVDRYCFFVAGVVGEILTRLVAINRGSYGVSEGQLVNAYHFGLFLQKVNLLKDQRSDEEQGRYLIPSRSEVFASLPQHARGAFDYILSIPESLLPFRLFCSWSLFLGLASLPWIERAWQQKDDSKIPRLETETLLQEIETIIADEKSLKDLFDLLLTFIENKDADSGVVRKMKATDRATSAVTLEFSKLYHGLLPEAQWGVFGLA